MQINTLYERNSQGRMVKELYNVACPENYIHVYDIDVTVTWSVRLPGILFAICEKYYTSHQHEINFPPMCLQSWLKFKFNLAVRMKCQKQKYGSQYCHQLCTLAF